MANTIGTAYIQIEPSAQGIEGKLTNILNGEATKAGTSAGSKISSAIGTAFKTGTLAVAGFTTLATTATGALTSAANSVSQYGDNIDKTSQKLGLSASSFQEWEYVMNLAGTSMNNMGTGLKTLTNKLDDAKNGSESSQKMFEALGLSMEDLSTMSREDVFSAVITGFQGMADTTERAALANDLFGRSGQELTPLFNTTAEETTNLKEHLKEMGAVMSDDAVKASANFQDSLTTMQTAFTGIKNSAMGELLPSFTSIMDGITDLVTGVDGGKDKIESGMDSLVENISNAMPSIIDGFSVLLEAIIEVAPQLIESLANGIIDAIPNILPSLVNLVTEITQGIIKLLPELIKAGMEVILELAKGIAESLPTLIPTIVEVVLEITDTLIDNVDLLIDGAIALIVGLTEGIIDALPKLIEKVPEIVIKLTESLIKNAPKLVEASIKLILSLQKGLLDNIPKLIQAIPQLITALKNSFINQLSAMVSIGSDLVNGIKQGIKQAWESLTSWLSSLCGNLVDIVKRALKIGSPSKVFRDEVGQWIPEGIAVGIEGNTDVLEDSMDVMQNALDPKQIDVSTNYATNYNNTSDNGVLDLLNKYLPQLANMQITLDSGALVGATAPAMNNALGMISAREGYR